jgi:hypothetical protein
MNGPEIVGSTAAVVLAAVGAVTTVLRKAGYLKMGSGPNGNGKHPLCDKVLALEVNVATIKECAQNIEQSVTRIEGHCTSLYAKTDSLEHRITVTETKIDGLERNR